MTDFSISLARFAFHIGIIGFIDISSNSNRKKIYIESEIVKTLIKKN